MLCGLTVTLHTHITRAEEVEVTCYVCVYGSRSTSKHFSEQNIVGTGEMLDANFCTALNGFPQGAERHREAGRREHSDAGRFTTSVTATYK